MIKVRKSISLFAVECDQQLLYWGGQIPDWVEEDDNPSPMTFVGGLFMMMMMMSGAMMRIADDELTGFMTSNLTSEMTRSETVSLIWSTGH